MLNCRSVSICYQNLVFMIILTGSGDQMLQVEKLVIHILLNKVVLGHDIRGLYGIPVTHTFF